MADHNRKSSSGAVEQIIDNMTSDIQNADGQYIQLGFTPPPTSAETWNVQNKLPYVPHYNLVNGLHNQDPHMYGSVDQFNQQLPYNFVQQPALFANNGYENHSAKDINQHYFDVYQRMHNKTDINMFHQNYKLFMPDNMNMSEHNFPQNHQDNAMLSNNTSMNSSCSTPNHTHLIENLVGNWVPNTSGTYSPFGNVPSYKPNLFESQPSCLGNMVRQDEPTNHTVDFADRSNEDIPFQFNRDTKKPRIVAEVKPMRPSYSDVLLKSAPQPAMKPSKNEFKDSKLKKESKKNLKNEKTQKLNSSLNRSTNNESKDLPTDKNTQTSKNYEKLNKENKTNQLNRKWSSLDNVTETFSDAKSEMSDSSKGKKSDDSINRNTKVNHKKINKNSNDFAESANKKTENLTITKTTIKKNTKVLGRPRNSDSFGNSDRPPGKRTQRNRKRENVSRLGFARQKLKTYLSGWGKIFASVILWLVHLIADICSLSLHLSRDIFSNMWSWLTLHWSLFVDNAVIILKRIRFVTWLWEKIRRKKDSDDSNRSFKHAGLQNNINMPTTGEEAMKRLLACKGKDPYSILGVTPGCSDEDIKKYYKRQAVLVHPDKNQQPGAEEAFKILVHAFNMIGEPERRQAYDRGVAESAQVEQAWSELTELLAQLQQKVEAAANTIRCSACGLRHKRIKMESPSYAARNCAQCKIHHSAREGDIWAEARCFGFLWHYYACMDGGVYDITEWAGCQKDSLKHLRPDSHHVQYRIALGKQNAGSSRRYSSSPRSEHPPDLENLLNSLYGQNDTSQNTRRRNKKNK